jgi:spermidine synthase
VVVVVLGASTSWNLENFHLRLAQRPLQILTDYLDGELERTQSQLDILEFTDGSAASVSAVRVEGEYNTMFINGKPDASEEFYDMQTQYLVGVVPVLLHPRADDATSVLVVGLGSGVTTAAVEATGVRDLTTVEISRKVVEIADRYFQRSNEGVLSRTPVVVDDGRSYLDAIDRQFDVIVSVPSNPWITGVSNLFTDEYWRSVREHLRDDGVFCQWMQYYSVDAEAVYGVVATLRRSFDQVHAFLLEGGDLMFVASNAPIVPDWGRLANPTQTVERMMRSIGYADPTDVLRRYVWSPESTARLRSTYPPNRDDRPWLEFDAPRFLFEKATIPNEVRFVRQVPDHRARLPMTLPAPPESAPTVLAPIGLDMHRLPPDHVLASTDVEIDWTITDDEFVSSRAWLRARYEGPGTAYLEVRSPLIRKPPTVEEAAELLRGVLGKTAEFGQSTVHGHSMIGARSPDEPGRVVLFWFCAENERNYLIDQYDGGTGAGYVVPECVHAGDGASELPPS